MAQIHSAVAQCAELSLLGFADKAAVLQLVDLIQSYRATAHEAKSAAMSAIAARGISQPRFYRLLNAYDRHGVRALFPLKIRRRIARDQAELDVGLPGQFVERCWKILCEESQRCIAAAYRSLFHDHLCAGKVIAGYESDWRGIWSAEHRGWRIPEHCPYRPHTCTPRGWSEGNLRRHAPGAYELTAARVGLLAAREYLPTIPTTRVGLPFGRVYVIDDLYHDAKISFVGNRSPQIVVELGALELLSGHYCTWGCKPVRERDDGTREQLREGFTRYLLADICCRIGICPQGCLIAGEHGTAHLPSDLVETLNRWTGNLISFSAGGIHANPIVRGCFQGVRRGNFRFKAPLESLHNLRKNDLALLPGQKGADPDRAPEDLAAKESYHRALIKACTALADTRPDLCNAVASPFPPYHQYVQAVGMIYDRIADRTEHDLEGFEECGFLIEEWRLHASDTWKPMSMLDGMDPAEAQAIRALVRAKPRERHNLRLMSPREAFERSAATQPLFRLPEAAVPEILGPSLGHVLPVQDSAQFLVPDPYLPRSHQVAAIVHGPDGIDSALDRGSKWLVHMSPFDARFAYVSHPEGGYVGKAPVLLAGTKVDAETLHRNLGIVARLESSELRKLAPLGEKRQREELAMRLQNARLLTGADPLVAAADAGAIARAGAGRVCAEDLAAAVDRGTAEADMSLEEVASLIGNS